MQFNGKVTNSFKRAEGEVQALNQLDNLLEGKEQVMSEERLDWLIEQGLLPDDVVSIPNPNQCGILDKYLVGKTSCPTIASYRRRKGYE